ncbi:MAG: PEFG-CTERM sorting domain-containing protein [Nitrosotalea sp.]
MALIIFFSAIKESDAQSNSVNTLNTPNWNGSPIHIYRDSLSPTSEVHIEIYAPDFNSNPYLIDTIGDDPQNKLIISTREGSIPYRLVETGPDTGIFAGYVILSSTTSVCSPVCGPTDGFLAASGDSAITVSFTYSKDETITNTSQVGYTLGAINGSSTPEFGSLASLVITISIIGVIIFSRSWKNTN